MMKTNFGCGNGDENRVWVFGGNNGSCIFDIEFAFLEVRE